ncbi:hypothetical protein [Sphingobium sp. DC-2]|uniref:hypothetical protein n=1 Tax=Sphingobium sp. DC-2 TaxID=1303256 RepID=UPI0004C4045A|nr:hypothetical protein [Sphingobium sp. DC-2]
MKFFPQATPSSLEPASGFFREALGELVTTSWSDLTSSLLQEAEQQFGPRDPRWFFAGIQFWDEGHPGTYYPGSRPFHVGISLTREAASNPRMAHYQLAHEVVHLLGPSPTFAPATVLEEGMAYSFQERVNLHRHLGMRLSIPSYAQARDVLNAMLALDPDAVRTIRAVYPDVRDVRSAELMRLVPAVSLEIADLLCRPFFRGE